MESEDFQEVIDDFYAKFSPEWPIYMLGSRVVREVAFSENDPHQKRIQQLVSIQRECGELISYLADQVTENRTPG